MNSSDGPAITLRHHAKWQWIQRVFILSGEVDIISLNTSEDFQATSMHMSATLSEDRRQPTGTVCVFAAEICSMKIPTIEEFNNIPGIIGVARLSIHTVIPKDIVQTWRSRAYRIVLRLHALQGDQQKLLAEDVIQIPQPGTTGFVKSC
ncbi:uncharacterized protein M437DRAFT_89279 [Aureobasidium melanogenum CBS 110374]|uniref:Uncharacterized protein n=1 Tax=Aureobasidium melanogenum (strain CBS 110374) TaxID=1043003 RepID=A0A074VJ77_AURM1|nr:uncharacterized protein M437DRAFT_89279 [Aureobasidium melanogenum CBS 110374]KEQ57642.1 hypothetical protein M437DRAFT_89279 [Aureobasidium melanogenum CBS 110374]